MSVRDGRTPPFIWQSVRSLEHLRRQWACRRPGASIGFAVYMGLCEIANEDRARASIGGQSEGFRATRAKIALRSCVSARTVDAAAAELVRIGLLVVTERGRTGRANTYVLLEPEGAQPVPTSRRGAQPVRTGCATGAHGVRNGCACEGHKKEENEEYPPTPASGGAEAGARS